MFNGFGYKSIFRTPRNCSLLAVLIGQPLGAVLLLAYVKQMLFPFAYRRSTFFLVRYWRIVSFGKKNCSVQTRINLLRPIVLNFTPNYPKVMCFSCLFIPNNVRWWSQYVKKTPKMCPLSAASNKVWYHKSNRQDRYRNKAKSVINCHQLQTCWFMTLFGQPLLPSALDSGSLLLVDT